MATTVALILGLQFASHRKQPLKFDWNATSNSTRNHTWKITWNSRRNQPYPYFKYIFKEHQNPFRFIHDTTFEGSFGKRQCQVSGGRTCGKKEVEEREVSGAPTGCTSFRKEDCLKALGSPEGCTSLREHQQLREELRKKVKLPLRTSPNTLSMCPIACFRESIRSTTDRTSWNRNDLSSICSIRESTFPYLDAACLLLSLRVGQGESDATAAESKDESARLRYGNFY